MYIASLIAEPGKLDPSLPVALRNALGGGDVSWLAQGRAAEFPLPALPAHRADIWSQCQGKGVDLNFLTAVGRRKRVLIADMDSTMIDQECIDEMAAEAGLGDSFFEITARAMNGELDFETALTERVGLLRGQPVALIDRVLARRISYAAGGASLVATMRANGAFAALVSGGFTAFTSAVAAHLGFDEHRANTLLTDQGVLSGAVAQPILGRDAKVTALSEITERLGITAQDAVAVGDGANDLGMLGTAGLGVALHAKPAVQEQADTIINFGDLTSLLYLQGYCDAELA
ncbi:MAG: phosphoserine phosphatase SerB [Pseudomonadota bacterium]